MLKQFTNNEVSKAGEAMKHDNLSDKELEKNMEILTYWRESHIQPLNEAEKLLKRYLSKIDKQAFIAKRIKRFDSIKKKLKRFSGMELKNMQDIGGIRVVLSTLKQVDELKNILLSEHKDCFFNGDKAIKIDDYINSPKEDGYRCLHIVGKFKNIDGKERKIEIQIRTRLQHSWATTLEIVDLFTFQDLKSNNGLLGYKDFFLAVSKQFTILENLNNFNKKEEELTKEYLELVSKDESILKTCFEIHGFLNKQDIAPNTPNFYGQLENYLKLFKSIEIPKSTKSGYLLVRLNTKSDKLDSEFFDVSKNNNALKYYSLYEQTLSKNKDWVVALISTNAIGGLREAYPNYFADCKLFLEFIQIIRYPVFVHQLNSIRNFKFINNMSKN